MINLLKQYVEEVGEVSILGYKLGSGNILALNVLSDFPDQLIL